MIIRRCGGHQVVGTTLVLSLVVLRIRAQRQCIPNRNSLVESVQDYLQLGETSTAARFYGYPIGTWCFHERVTDFSRLFAGESTFDEDLSRWNLQHATDLSGMFEDAVSFNQNLSTWDVSGVTDMSRIFLNAQSFDGSLSNWETGRVQNFSGAFDFAHSFRGVGLENWDVSSAVDMFEMFRDADDFVADIGDWNVTSLENAAGMFASAAKFDANLVDWNVQNLVAAQSMFTLAVSYRASLCPWRRRLPLEVVLRDMFFATSCPDVDDPVKIDGRWEGPFCHVCPPLPPLSSGASGWYCSSLWLLLFGASLSLLTNVS